MASKINRNCRRVTTSDFSDLSEGDIINVRFHQASLPGKFLPGGNAECTIINPSEGIIENPMGTIIQITKDTDDGYHYARTIES